MIISVINHYYNSFLLICAAKYILKLAVDRAILTASVFTAFMQAKFKYLNDPLNEICCINGTCDEQLGTCEFYLTVNKDDVIKMKIKIMILLLFCINNYVSNHSSFS